jgi:hypothetical protein
METVFLTKTQKHRFMAAIQEIIEAESLADDCIHPYSESVFRKAYQGRPGVWTKGTES